MYHVYLLQSKKDNKLYTGYTDDLKRRLNEHHNGLVQSTKSRRPLKLLYYEAYNKESEARKREGKLKQFGSSYQGLIKRLEL